MTFVDGIKYLSDVDIEMKLRFSCQQLKTSGKAKAGDSEFTLNDGIKYQSNVDVVMKCVAKLATAVTAVKAGDNEFTLYDGIKYLSNVDVVMKLRCSYQQLVTAVKACKSCQSMRELSKL